MTEERRLFAPAYTNARLHDGLAALDANAVRGHVHQTIGLVPQGQVWRDLTGALRLNRHGGSMKYRLVIAASGVSQGLRLTAQALTDGGRAGVWGTIVRYRPTSLPHATLVDGVPEVPDGDLVCRIIDYTVTHEEAADRMDWVLTLEEV